MSTFLGQALKSRQGDKKWLEFFEVTGSAFAWLEKSPRVPFYDDLSKKETFLRVKEAEQKLGVLSKLRGFTIAADAITRERGQGSYHLIVLDSKTKSVAIKPYPSNRLEEAITEYAKAEARTLNGEPVEAVLVSSGPVELLRRAYPNYFLDTEEFLTKVQKVMKAVS